METSLKKDLQRWIEAKCDKLRWHFKLAQREFYGVVRNFLCLVFVIGSHR